MELLFLVDFKSLITCRSEELSSVSNYMILCNKKINLAQKKKLTYEGLNWNNHIDQACKRSMKMLGVLNKGCPPTQSFCSHGFLLGYIYISIPIHELLQYCLVCILSIYKLLLINSLLIQKRFIRISLSL